MKTKKKAYVFATDAHVIVCDEDGDEVGEKLWSVAAERHEGRARDVLRNLEGLDDHLNRLHKILVANGRLRIKHVGDHKPP